MFSIMRLRPPRNSIIAGLAQNISSLGFLQVALLPVRHYEPAV